jgi:hypothetical protein
MMASGVIPDSSMVISDIMVTESGATDPYILLSFPSRVTITGVSFTINDVGLGVQGDGLEYSLYATKGKQAAGIESGEEWDEDIVQFFPNDGKPVIVCDATKFRSTIGVPQATAEWITAHVPAYVAAVAQMDTDEYLVLWVENTDGDDTNILSLTNGWDDVRATITINYTGATGTD